MISSTIQTASRKARITGTWSVKKLQKAGFDQLPCTSNYFEDGAADAVVKYCLEHIDPSRLKGMYVAPWNRITPDTPEKKNFTKGIHGIDLFTAARNRYCKAEG